MTIIILNKGTSTELVRLNLGRFENVDNAIRNILNNLCLRLCDVDVIKKIH